MELSNGLKLDGLSAKLQLLDKTLDETHENLSALFPEHTIGSLTFYPGPASLSGELWLNAQSLEEVWQQVRQGGYSSCMITVHFGLDRLTRADGMHWLWDVTNVPHLLIEQVTVLFERQSS